MVGHPNSYRILGIVLFQNNQKLSRGIKPLYSFLFFFALWTTVCNTDIKVCNTYTSFHRFLLPLETVIVLLWWIITTILDDDTSKGYHWYELGAESLLTVLLQVSTQPSICIE